jgi:ATP-dependent Clp protease protease subunit
MVNELLRLQTLGNALLAHDTGKTPEQITADFSRDRFMTALEAKEYGFVDQILETSQTPSAVAR